MHMYICICHKNMYIPHIHTRTKKKLLLLLEIVTCRLKESLDRDERRWGKRSGAHHYPWPAL